MSQIPRTCTGRSGCTCLARHHGQWQGPLSGVAAGVTVRGTAGSMGQLQIMAGGVTGCTVLSVTGARGPGELEDRCHRRGYGLWRGSAHAGAGKQGDHDKDGDGERGTRRFLIRKHMHEVARNGQ